MGLIELLLPLCSTEEDNKILEGLVSKVVNFDEGTIEFEDCQFEYENNEVNLKDEVPASFNEITKVASALFWDGGGPEVGFSMASNGEPDGDIWLLDEIEEKKSLLLLQRGKLSFHS